MSTRVGLFQPFCIALGGGDNPEAHSHSEAMNSMTLMFGN